MLTVAVKLQEEKRKTQGSLWLGSLFISNGEVIHSRFPQFLMEIANTLALRVLKSSLMFKVETAQNQVLL